jgi:hypothetical protein
MRRYLPAAKFICAAATLLAVVLWLAAAVAADSAQCPPGADTGFGSYGTSLWPPSKECLHSGRIVAAVEGIPWADETILALAIVALSTGTAAFVGRRRRPRPPLLAE